MFKTTETWTQFTCYIIRRTLQKSLLFLLNETDLDCNYTLSIYLALVGTTFGAKSIGKV